MEAFFSLVAWIFFVFIVLFLLYWVVKSAINDSELVTLLRSIDHKLENMKSNIDISVDERDQNLVKAVCPACNSRISIDSSTCPECGIVFRDE